MDPITALVLASLVTWGTAGGGIKDTAAILKGQTPPSYAYRTAKMAASERERKAAHALMRECLDKGKPIPAHLEPRRIRMRDLVRHWWEDALEDADHWRSTTRGKRRAARQAWRAKRKAQVKRGYELLKRRGEERFATPEPEELREPEEPQQAPDSEGPRGGDQGLPDNVIPFNKQKGAGGGPQESRDPVDESPDSLPDREAREALGDFLDAKNTQHTNEKEAPVAIDLSDAPTLAAHLKALQAYTGYLNKIAADMDALAAGMRSHQMGDIAVSEVSFAGIANSEAASSISAARTQLEQAHTPVADARQAAPEAADGEYFTRGR
ncbi:hypothetical protein [Streptomyces sp. NPDC000931]|uniref:hypothetical protein n=1 Tax=Streptomyces sp. NPDC000931 TaxID=3154372 RepID=UPI00333259C1